VYHENKIKEMEVIMERSEYLKYLGMLCEIKHQVEVVDANTGIDATEVVDAIQKLIDTYIADNA
jgi:hypothetical protein